MGRLAAVLRAGVTVTYALAPRLALSGFGGYLWSRPSFMVSTPTGLQRTRIRGDSAILDGGVIVTLF